MFNRRAAVFALALAAMPLFAAPASQPAELPVKSVTLYTSGVGFFRHDAAVTGDGRVTLKFKTEQINDVIKSLVVQDAGGRVAGVQYPSQDPLDKTLKTFQVDLTGAPTMADLLAQLRGAKVVIQVAGEEVKGTVVGIEKRQVPSTPPAGPTEQAVLTLFDNERLRQVILEQVQSLKLDDPTVAADMARALAVVAGGRDQDKKPVTINFTGQGDHRLAVGYVVETPVWKVTYRLLLKDPAAAVDRSSTRPAAQDHLQGWAVVENQTDSDWNDVSLSLVSGRPISFVMDLYQPIYLKRPTAELNLFAGLRPQVYYGGAQAQQNLAAMGNAAFGASDMAKASRSRFAVPAAAAPQLGMAGAAVMADENERTQNSAFGFNESIRTSAITARLGALFQFNIEHVSLPRQQSSLVPIVTDAVQAEPMSIYNETVLPRNPLTGVMLTNNTGKLLPQGPITVLSGGAYAGDAQIEDLPAGQKRLLSFGVDLETFVAVKPEGGSELIGGKIAKGVLELSRRQSQVKTYTVENKSDVTRTVVVEHPLYEGWALVDTPTPMEQTDKRYRFKLTVEKGKTESLKVTQQQPVSQTLQLLDSDLNGLVFHSKQGVIPQKVRDALVEAIKRRQALADLERQAAEKGQAIDRIGTEQNRLRENMRVVDKNGQYYGRLLAKLNEQESQIEKLQGERDDLTKKVEQARSDLQSYLNDLSVQ